MGAITLLAATGLVAAEISTAPSAGAATIPISPSGDVSVRLSQHVSYVGPAPSAVSGISFVNVVPRYGDAANGVLSGTPGNTAPGAGGSTGSFGATGWVSSGRTAWTAHGRNAVAPPTLDLSIQSALGFEPRSLGTSIETDTPVNIGRIIHQNNTISSVSGEWFQGDLNVQFMGSILPYRWQMNETTNVPECGVGGCDDVVTFLNDTTETTFFSDGRLFTFVLEGFSAPDASNQCDPTLADTSELVDEFLTVEFTATYGCLYASVQEVHTLEVLKLVDSPYSEVSPESPSFDFTASSSLDGTFWDEGSFALAHTESRSGEFLTNEEIVITEEESDYPWAFTSVDCVNDSGDPLPEATYDGSTVTIAPGVTATSVLCIYTNSYEPRSTLSLEKVVEAGADVDPATAADWTLSAQGVGPVEAESVSGAGGSAEIVGQSVISGEYSLSEASNDDTATVGYEQSGDWVCVTDADEPVDVSEDDPVVLEAGANVTCTVMNAYVSGQLAITKTVSTTPAGGYTQGSDVGFTASYACLPGGPSGTVTVYPSPTNGTAGEAVLVPNVPAGAECTVTETHPPTGSADLADSSWIWSAPTNPAPVTVEAGETAIVNIGNSATQSMGEFVVALSVAARTGTSSSGYTGGDDREFSVTYQCTIGEDLVASGSFVVSPGTPVTVSAPLTSECIVTGQVLASESGDFADDQYAWDGFTFTAAVTIGAGDAPRIDVTNYYERVVAPAAVTPPKTMASTGLQTGGLWILGVLLAGLGALVLILRKRIGTVR